MKVKAAMTRSVRRPEYLDLPYPLSPSPPVPRPQSAVGNGDGDPAPRTRYGDWHREGIAWDF